jgi:hypothetical protein
MKFEPDAYRVQVVLSYGAANAVKPCDRCKVELCHCYSNILIRLRPSVRRLHGIACVHWLWWRSVSGQ